MSKHVVVAVAFVALAGLAGSAQQASVTGGGIPASIEAKKDQYAAVAKQIWDYAELGFQEEKSSALLQKTLADAGIPPPGTEACCAEPARPASATNATATTTCFDMPPPTE